MLFIVFLLLLIFTTLENYFRESERFKNSKKAGLYWHVTQWLALAITFTYMCFTKYGFKSLEGYSLLLVYCSLWWIGFDGGLNLLRGLPFFRVSTQSSDPTQSWGRPVIKIIFALIALVIYSYTKFLLK